jgi:hypothetical protein
MNQQMDPAEVLGVEIKQYVAGAMRTLVPSVIGQTEEAQQRQSTGPASTRQWDKETFFSEMSQLRSENDVQLASKLFEWSEADADRIYWGHGSKSGAFVPVVHRGGVDYQVGAVMTYGTMEIYFQWLRRRPALEGDAERIELLKRLNAVPGVRISPDAITLRPPVRLAEIAQANGVTHFVSVLDWVVELIRDYHEPK